MRISKNYTICVFVLLSLLFSACGAGQSTSMPSSSAEEASTEKPESLSDSATESTESSASSVSQESQESASSLSDIPDAASSSEVTEAPEPAEDAAPPEDTPASSTSSEEELLGGVNEYGEDLWGDAALSFTSLPIEGPDKGEKDWTKMQITIDTVTETLPFSFEKLTDAWEFDPYVEDPEALAETVLDAHAYSDLISLSRKEDSDMWILVTFVNTTTGKVLLPEASLAGISIDRSYGTPVPEIALAEDIGWESTAEDILRVFGKPTEAPMYFEKEGFTIYAWSDAQGKKSMNLTVSDSEGLLSVMLNRYD